MRSRAARAARITIAISRLRTIPRFGIRTPSNLLLPLLTFRASTSRRAPRLQTHAIHGEGDIDISPGRPRVWAALMGSQHQFLGLGPREVWCMQVQGSRQSKTARFDG